MLMKLRRLSCAILALAMIFSLWPLSILSAGAEQEVYGMTTANGVNLRVSASTKANYLFYLPVNYVCVVKGEVTAEKIHWYKVEAKQPNADNNRTYPGYVHGDYFRLLTADETQAYLAGNSVNTSTPIPESGNGPTPTPTPLPNKNVDQNAIPGTTGVVTSSGTNFREGPGKGYHSIEKLDRGAEVEVLTIPSVLGNGANTWYYVRYGNQYGYIMSDFLRITSGGVANGVVTAAPATQVPSVVTAVPSVVTAVPSVVTATPAVSEYTHVRLILSSCHLRVSPEGVYDSANDWEGQGTSLPLNGNPIVKGRYTWYPVLKNGRTWYVRSDCVQPYAEGSEDIVITPAPTQTGAVTPTATPAKTSAVGVLGYVQTIKGGVNLRATINGTVIRQVGKYEIFAYLLEPVKKNGYTWYFVQAGDNRGYLRGDMVKEVASPTSNPIVTPTPTSQSVVTPTPTHATGLITPTPIPGTITGYVKTTSSGVNLRKEAGYTEVIGRVDRNLVMPWYGNVVVVKGVTWYQVNHPTLGMGWLHASYLVECDANGVTVTATPVVTTAPTVAPTGSVPTTTPNSGSQAEASYNTLKLGSTGQAVKNLITELKNQGYYTGSVGTKYTTAVETAVRNFQAAKGLTVDGIAGSATQHKLFNTVPIGSGDSTNLTMTIYPAEKIDWNTGGINELWARGSNYKVYDVKTGIVWWAHRWAGGLHVDAEPLTAADTGRLCKIYGVNSASEITSKNHWQRRPCLVTIGTRTFACSLYGVPHNDDGDTIKDNAFQGQLCIHFTNSKIHNSHKVDSLHQEAIQYAWENAPNGHI